MVNSPEANKWSPGEHFKQRPADSATPAALLILNQPIEDIHGFRRLWERRTFRICADGGANRLYQFFSSYEDILPDLGMTREAYLPDEIHGDLDSLMLEVELYYKDHGVQITRDPDQYSTDFTKCLKRIRTVLPRLQDDHESNVGDDQALEEHLEVLVLGGLGGRVDQAFSTVHHLYSAAADLESNAIERGKQCKMYLYSPESVSMVLPKGRNIIKTPLGDGFLAENIGILPVGRPAVISTKGLEWDVDNWSTEFGGQVSTSNHIRSDVVEVETDERVLFTVETAKQLL